MLLKGVFLIQNHDVFLNVTKYFCCVHLREVLLAQPNQTVTERNKMITVQKERLNL